MRGLQWHLAAISCTSETLNRENAEVDRTVDVREVKLLTVHIATAEHLVANRDLFTNCSVPPPVFPENYFCGVHLSCFWSLAFRGRDVMH